MARRHVHKKLDRTHFRNLVRRRFTGALQDEKFADLGYRLVDGTRIRVVQSFTDINMPYGFTRIRHK